MNFHDERDNLGMSRRVSRAHSSQLTPARWKQKSAPTSSWLLVRTISTSPATVTAPAARELWISSSATASVRAGRVAAPEFDCGSSVGGTSQIGGHCRIHADRHSRLWRRRELPLLLKSKSWHRYFRNRTAMERPLAITSETLLPVASKSVGGNGRGTRVPSAAAARDWR